MSFNCKVCNKSCDSKHKQAKFCSVECRRSGEKIRWGRYSSEGVAAGTVGAMSELVVAVDLMDKGFAVFRSLSPSCLCDLIAFKDEKSLRVEVRTGYLSEKGIVSFPLKPSDAGRQDLYGVFVRNEKKVFYFYPNKEPYVFI